MEDILQSRQRAMVKQGWLWGDRMWRIGNPFEWTDGEHHQYMHAARDVRALLQAIGMYYEQYPTPEKIKTKDHDEVLRFYEETLTATIRNHAPFLQDKPEWQNHVRCTSVARTQDYCAVKTFCKELPSAPQHLDLGPGLGSHAVYSLQFLKGTFYALEAIPHMYDIQRQFLRFLAPRYGTYLDLVEAENFSLTDQEIAAELSNQSHSIKHVPSWGFPHIKDKSMDLVTATWMLNEVSYAGILWLLSNALRVTKDGGYLYIRDSSKLKPNRHAIPYDQLLLEFGFEKAGQLDVQNRVDFWGVPRVYRKAKTVNKSFEELVDHCLGKFAVVVHGGTYNQNLDTVPKK